MNEVHVRQNFRVFSLQSKVNHFEDRRNFFLFFRYVCWAVKPLQRYSNLHPAHCSTTITNHWILKLCHKITGDKRWKMAFLRGNRKLLRPAMLRMSLITFVYWRLPNWIKQTGAAFNSHNIIAEKRRGSKRI